MSPEQWLALARRGYGSWARGDPEDLIAMLNPDIVFHTSGVFPDFTGDYEGHDGMRRFWREMCEPWESFDIKVKGVEPYGEDTAVVDIRFSGTGRSSGVHVELDFFHVARAEGSLIAELSAYASREQAVAEHDLAI